MMSRAALVISLLAIGCSEHLAAPSQPELKIGIEQALVDSGFGAYVQAAFEHQHRVRTRLVAGDASTVEGLIKKGVVDTAIVTSDQSIARLERDGLIVSKQAFAHEELVFIGPTEDKFRSHGSSDAVEFLKNVTRSAYKYIVPREGSAEHHRLEKA